jgi:SAM-dependent methyltransferase
VTTLSGLPASHRCGSTLTLRGAMATARSNCAPDCFAYHVSWRVFRRLGLKGNPFWHQGFYAAALTTWPRPVGAATRVLICGASDEAMLATINRLFGGSPGPSRPTVHMIDACPTPLLLARAYADAHRIALTATVSTAPHLPGVAGRFDVIVTDGLLSLLPEPGDRLALIRRLGDLLAPGGLVLYTTRLAGRRGVLEYDRLGRLLRAAVTAGTWPRSGRLTLGRRALTGSSRPNPYTSAAHLRAAFDDHFQHVALSMTHRPASRALRVHPWTLADRITGPNPPCTPGGASDRWSSTLLGIAAAAPRQHHRGSSPAYGNTV